MNLTELFHVPVAEARALNVLTIYRGETRGNKGGNFWTTDFEFAKQFTQSGQDREVLTRYIWGGDIYMKSKDTYAGNEAGFDAAMESAKADEYKAFMLSEGPGEPNSIFVFDKSALLRTKPTSI